MALHGSWPQGGVGGLQAGQFQAPHLVNAVGLPGGQCLCHDVVGGAPVGVPDLERDLVVAEPGGA